MELPQQLIRKRLSAAEPTHGSIVATAAWVAVHAAEATAILGVWAALISSPDVAPRTRVALLYVLHELITTSSGAGPAGRAQRVPSANAVALQEALRKVVPTALPAAAALGDPTGTFRAALVRSLEWWAAARLLPQQLLLAVSSAAGLAVPGADGGERGADGGARSRDNDDGGDGGGDLLSSRAARVEELPPAVRSLVKLLQDYARTKERHQRAAAADDAAATDLAAAAAGTLTEVARLLEGGVAPADADGGSGSRSGSSSFSSAASLSELRRELRRELDELRVAIGAPDAAQGEEEEEERGLVAADTKAEVGGGGGRAKTGARPSAAAEKDDLLGDYF